MTGILPILTCHSFGPVSWTLVPAESLERSAVQQYAQMLAQARAQGALAADGNPQLMRLRAIAKRLIPFAAPWNERARAWRCRA